MAESTLKIGTGEALKENRLGLKSLDYQGGKSTLCAGCGHDAISNQIVRAFYGMNVKPENVAKFSGIGCSSKTPAYFLSRSHGLNSVHGRMPSVATGAAPCPSHRASWTCPGSRRKPCACPPPPPA